MTSVITPDWPAPANINAYTTLKDAWGKGDYKSPSTRQSLTSLLNLPSEPIWLNQIHANNVVEATPNMVDQQADASFTQTPNRVCIILTADCLPIFITNKQGTEVAAIHAGWRSLAGGVIENTLTKLTSSKNDLLVWLGPAIGPKKFEVGKDVYDAFTRQHSEAADAFIPHTKEKWLANLYSLATLRLAHFGINNIYGGNFCTYTQEDLFHSYRRDEPPACGRMANVIWISKPTIK